MSLHGEEHGEEELLSIPVHVWLNRKQFLFAFQLHLEGGGVCLSREDVMLTVICLGRLKRGPPEGYDRGYANDDPYVRKQVLHIGPVVGSVL